jgi:hypothetical protein
MKNVNFLHLVENKKNAANKKPYQNPAKLITFIISSSLSSPNP